MPSLEENLREKLVDDFSQRLLSGALQVIPDQANPIRLSQFAAAMRELFNYTLHTLAPDGNVTKCVWFKLEPGTASPTRRQRAKYATQGGLSDEYVAEIGVDVEHLHDEAIAAIGEMSKYTHVRPGTLVEDQGVIDAFVNDAMTALLGLFSSFEHCRETVIEALVNEIDDEAVNALITETIQEVDQLSSHHSIEEVYVDKMRIVSLTQDAISFEVTGSLAVELQWGSNSDVRRGDGATLDQSFPFTVTMCCPVDDVSTFYDVVYGVDTSEWTDRRDERD
ncbi:MAG TPA: hypothetical protein VFI23_10290 [Rhizomicrobium sp.]|nr:hypothetical protein [Rhizomicrobium sp.]